MTIAARKQLLQILLEKSMELDENRLAQVLGFIEFVNEKVENKNIRNGIQIIANKNESFNAEIPRSLLRRASLF